MTGRLTAMLAGLALLVAACGGGEATPSTEEAQEFLAWIDETPEILELALLAIRLPDMLGVNTLAEVDCETALDAVNSYDRQWIASSPDPDYAAAVRNQLDALVDRMEACVARDRDAEGAAMGRATNALDEQNRIHCAAREVVGDPCADLDG